MAWGLSDLSSLVALAQESALDLRPIILRVQTDLFVAAPVRDVATIEAFEALACGLLPSIDADIAAIIARKLAPVGDTPPSVLRLLAGHSAEACCAVVALAPHLSSGMVEVAVAGAHQVAIAVATRADLDDIQLALLVEQDEAAIDLALAENHAVVLRGTVLDDLLARGRHDAAIATALLCRPSLSPADRAPLYLHADDVQRREIRAGVTTLAALRNAATAADAGLSRRLVEAAKRQDEDAFGRELAGAFRMARAPDWAFDAPHRHDLLPLALRAAGAAEEDGVSILLTLHTSIARSVDTVFRLVKLFRNVSQPSAWHLVQAIVGVPISVRIEGRHVPAFDPSGAPAPAHAARQTLAERRPFADRARRNG